MVTSVTNFGRSGVYDWLIQRVTAVVIGLYFIYMLLFLLGGDGSYQSWKALFDQTWMRVFSLLTLISVGAHAWIGLWTIATDYIKPTVARFVFEAACGLAMFFYLVWGIEILWGS